MLNSVEEAIPLAQQGNKAALEYLVQQLQPKIYGLALKMLWHPDDAKDAMQEILLRIITHIGSFRGESSFFTWAYRIGANHISNWRKSRLESQGLTFETFGRDLEEGLTTDLPGPDEALLFQEIRVGWYFRNVALPEPPPPSRLHPRGNLGNGWRRSRLDLGDS